MRVLLLLQLLLVASLIAAPKKKPKGKGGNSGPQVSAKAQPLLKQSSFNLDGKVQKSVTGQFYLDPEQKYRPTKIWGVDLPKAVAGVPMDGLVGRRMKVSFKGGAVARAGNQVKFEPKQFTGIKPLDGKPLPKKKATAQKDTGKKPAGKNANAGKKPAANSAGPMATAVADFKPNLPSVLILGDGNSYGYTRVLTNSLKGKANVTRPMKGRAPENCGNTANGRKHLKRWLGDTEWDLIHFNFGKADLASSQGYAKNLEFIAKTLKAAGGKVIFANTTPVEGKAKQVAALNSAAARIMKKHGIPVHDLHAIVKEDPDAKIATKVSARVKAALGIKAGKGR